VHIAARLSPAQRVARRKAPGRLRGRTAIARPNVSADAEFDPRRIAEVLNRHRVVYVLVGVCEAHLSARRCTSGRRSSHRREHLIPPRPSEPQREVNTSRVAYISDTTWPWVVRRCGVSPQWTPRTRTIERRALAVTALVVVPTFPSRLSVQD
jgi:hypothetical protein